MLKNAFIFILTVFCFFSIWQVNSKSNLSIFGTSYETYTVRSSSTSKIIPTDKLKFKNTFLKTGESVVLKDGNIEQVIIDLKAKILFSEETSEGVSIYAYSPKLKNKISLNGKTVNLQIFCSNNKTVIGTPIIFGSY